MFHVHHPINHKFPSTPPFIFGRVFVELGKIPTSPPPKIKHLPQWIMFQWSITRQYSSEKATSPRKSFFENEPITRLNIL